MSLIHPTAIVDSGATLAADVQVGPYALVGPQCTVGTGGVIAAHAILERNVRLGDRVRIGAGSIIGGDPQDLKYRGEETWVEIGDDTAIREYCTVNRGTSESLRTSIGSNTFLMSYVHVAHDCHIGNNVILANNAQLAGHVTVEDRAIVSGMAGIHQFVRIGAYAIVGGYSKVVKDIPPFVRADGNPAVLHGLNSIGLERNGMSEDVRLELKRLYRLFFRSELNLKQARQRAESELRMLPEVRQFLSFLDSSARGVGM